jgi:hypothetical protein
MCALPRVFACLDALRLGGLDAHPLALPDEPEVHLATMPSVHMTEPVGSSRQLT